MTSRDRIEMRTRLATEAERSLWARASCIQTDAAARRFGSNLPVGSVVCFRYWSSFRSTRGSNPARAKLAPVVFIWTSRHVCSNCRKSFANGQKPHSTKSLWKPPNLTPDPKVRGSNPLGDISVSDVITMTCPTPCLLLLCNFWSTVSL
jgi:hypothetical protein